LEVDRRCNIVCILASPLIALHNCIYNFLYLSTIYLFILDVANSSSLNFEWLWHAWEYSRGFEIVSFPSVNAGLYGYSGPGNWNDPDMLVGSTPGAAVFNTPAQVQFFSV
jgi:hypothetical protein